MRNRSVSYAMIACSSDFFSRVASMMIDHILEKRLKKQANLKNKHVSAPKTNLAIVNGDGGFVKLNTEFVCLGLTIGFLLADTAHAKHCARKESKSMGTLKFPWDT